MNRKSRMLACTMALLTSLGIVAYSYAASQLLVWAEKQTVTGIIKSVESESTFVLVVDGQSTIMTCGEDTRYRFNGADSTREEAIKEGYTAAVTHTNNRATLVETTSITKKP